MLPIARGVSLVVRRAKVPVIPVVIEGSYRA
jgi:1-acyl-sn-glycerol-3-phosphate acyltransferase